MDKKARIGIVEVRKGEDKLKKSKYKFGGVSGWLLVFIVILFVNIFYFIYDIMTSFYLMYEMPILFIFFILEIMTVILFGIGLYYLLNLNKKGVELLKWALWLPFFSYLLMAIIWLLLEIELYEELYVGLFSGFIWALIWTSYLRKSKRVQNTYYGKSYKKEDKIKEYKNNKEGGDFVYRWFTRKKK